MENLPDRRKGNKFRKWKPESKIVTVVENEVAGS
jgi:hypothetical protein